MIPTPSRTLFALAAILLTTAASDGAEAQDQADRRRTILRETFAARMDSLARAFPGVAGIEVVDLVNGERFGTRPDMVFPQGSAIKISILLELFRRAGEEPDLLHRRHRVRVEEQVGGSGVLRYLTDGGAELTLENLAVLMIRESDNTATNLLIDEVGMEAVNRLMDELGASRTRLQRKMIRPEASARGDENLSTPAEAADLMARIHRCDLPISETGCDRVREILEIRKGGPVARPIPGAVPVAFKPGGIEGVSTVWALVGLPDRPYVLTVMSTYGGPGGDLIESASEVAWEYFRRLSRSTEYGVRVPLELIEPLREPRR